MASSNLNPADLVTGESSTGFHACTWTVTVEEDNQGRRTVYMRGTEDPGIWQVKAIDGVSEGELEICGKVLGAC